MADLERRLPYVLRPQVNNPAVTHNPLFPSRIRQAYNLPYALPRSPMRCNGYLVDPVVPQHERAGELSVRASPFGDGSPSFLMGIII